MLMYLQKENEMLRAFKMVYGEETIISTLYDGKDTLIIRTYGGAYKVEYNNGNCETTYIG